VGRGQLARIVFKRTKKKNEFGRPCYPKNWGWKNLKISILRMIWFAILPVNHFDHLNHFNPVSLPSLFDPSWSW
jgi:hypothetical protein